MLVTSDELFWHNSTANNAKVPGFGTLSRWEVPHMWYIVASHLQRGSAIRWREDIEMDVAKISGGASNLAGYTNKTNLSDTIDGYSYLTHLNEPID